MRKINEETFLNLFWKWKLLSHVQLFATPWTIQSMEFSRPEYWTVGLSLLQRIFSTLGLNPGLLHCRWILYQLSHKGSPRILEWVAYPFSSRSSQPRNRTRVSCIAGEFFTNWAMRDALDYCQDRGKKPRKGSFVSQEFRTGRKSRVYQEHWEEKLTPCLTEIKR